MCRTSDTGKVVKGASEKERKKNEGFEVGRSTMDSGDSAGGWESREAGVADVDDS